MIIMMSYDPLIDSNQNDAKIGEEIIDSPSYKKMLIIGVIISLIVLSGVFSYSYIVIRKGLDSDVEQILETAQSDYQIINIQIYPLKADFLSVTTLKNSGKYDLDVSVVLNWYIDYNLLANSEGNLFLRSGENGTLKLTTRFESEAMQDYIESGETLRTKLSLTATSKLWGLVPITIIKTEA
jgi:hypothetical protein